MPINCGIKTYTIEKVLDSNGAVVDWKELFSLSNTGKFEVLDTKTVFTNHLVYISVATPGKQSDKNIAALKVSITPLIQSV
jgi:hypothetical protein